MVLMLPLPRRVRRGARRNAAVPPLRAACTIAGRPCAAVPSRAPAPAGSPGRRASKSHRRPALPPPGAARHATGHGPGGHGVAVLLSAPVLLTNVFSLFHLKFVKIITN